ncbi:MAG: hypothetical protein V3V29_00805 [Acidimicrobiia bacterium]
MARRAAVLSLVGVGCSSAGVLVFEIVLTRVFSVTQFYHFAFLTVSLALLGFGASGSALAAFPRLGRGGPRRWAVLAFAQGVSTLGAYALTNRIPFDSFAIAWDRRQIGYLIAYYLALAVPFFFGGTVIGALLSGWDQPVPLSSARVYGASLIGAGLGCVVAVGALPLVGGVGVIAVASVLGLVAAAIFETSNSPPSPILLVGVTAVAVTALLVTTLGSGVLELRLSPYKDLSAALRYPGATVIDTTWESSARIDHIASVGIRSVPGLSFTWGGAPPPQDGVTFDGDDLSPVPLVGPDEAEFSSHVLNSVAFSLRPGGDFLILESRGGLDVVVALATGAGSVTAVEAHGPAVEAARRAGSPAYADPMVEVKIEEPRSFVERTDRRFDVIDIALTAPYRPVTSGAYSLAEDYMLTTEAFDAYLDLMRPGGVLTIMRWLQTPPSETVRLLALAAEAIRRSGGDPEQAIIALRGYATGLVMVKPGNFTAEEVETVARFAVAERFDVIAAPGLGPSNLYNVLPDDQYAELATRVLTNPEDLYRSYEFDVAPPTDDQPFFTHFFKWAQASQVLDTLGRTWQPFGGAGFFVLVALLALSAVGAAVLVLGPLLVMTRRRSTGGRSEGRLWTVAYFGLLGLAFLLVEIPLVQQYILLVGRPTTALAVVLFALLLSAGAGSVVSHRMPWRPTAVALALSAVLYPPIVRWMTALVLPAPLAIRMVVGAVALVPIGFLMGVMFPKGLARLERAAPHLVPWAWGINGTASVIAAAAAALLALTWGFQLVMTVGGACYAAVALLARDTATEPFSLRRE